jgi:hypothetical protein
MLEEIIKELEEDLKINELNLKDYQLRLPAIKHKWAGRLIRMRMNVNVLKRQREIAKNDIMSEINNTSPVKLTQPVISSTADRHSKIQDLNTKIQETDLIIELLEKSEKTLSSTTFDIKNLIEIMKLEMT